MIGIIQYKFKLHESNLVFLFKCNYSSLAIQISNVVAHISAHSEPLDMPDFLFSNTVMHHGEKEYTVSVTCFWGVHESSKIPFILNVNQTAKTNIVTQFH